MGMDGGGRRRGGGWVGVRTYPWTLWLSIHESVPMVRLGRPSMATEPSRVSGGSLGVRKVSSALLRRDTSAAASGCQHGERRLNQ